MGKILLHNSIGEKLAAQIENISINPVDAVNKADTKFKFRSIEVCQIIKIIKKLANGKAVGIHSLLRCVMARVQY